MKRPSRIAHYAKIARLVALRGSCQRRKVGAIVTDEHGFILATGYNGRAVPGVPDCNEEPCEGINAKSGEDLDRCMARHAEMSIVDQISDTSKMHDLYITTSPCVECVKNLLGTGLQNIYYWEGYTDQQRQLASYYWKRYRQKGRWQALTNGSATQNLDIHTRFDLQWTEDPMTECWEWQGACTGRGYGSFHGWKKQMSAHRAAYIIYHEKDPGHLFVCHKCDNLTCVNPAHLFLGTNSDNIHDCYRKNKSAMLKLTEHQVKEVRQEWKTGKFESIKEIANKYGIGSPQMGRILANKARINI